jgi:hypothetical protein
MPERITVYYDYTCPYSNRALRWLAKVAQAGRELTVIWKAFPLKEVNRRPGQASFLSGTPAGSVSILALELAKAALAARSDLFGAYHNAVFDAMHGENQKRLNIGGRASPRAHSRSRCRPVRGGARTSDLA